MKTFAFLLVLAAPALALSTEIKPGDSLNDVNSALGMPIGQAQVGGKLVLFYDRGQVQLVDGRVTDVNLLSPQDFAAHQAQQTAEAAQTAQIQAERAAEGEALKAKKLADPAFISAPPSYQVGFWQDFRRQYPEVSCDDEYKLALARLQEQQAAQDHDQQIANLEARVANAEDNAAQAERDARQARYNNAYPGPFFAGDVFRHDHFRDHHNDACPPLARPVPLPIVVKTTASLSLTMPPSATSLKPPPSAAGLTPPPSAWPQ